MPGIAGWLYKPVDGSPQRAWPKDVVDGVETLQVAGRYMLGERDSHGLNFEKIGGRMDSYFVLDGQTRELTTVSSIQELQRASLPLGISVKLEAVRAVYLGTARPIRQISRGFVSPRYAWYGCGCWRAGW